MYGKMFIQKSRCLDGTVAKPVPSAYHEMDCKECTFYHLCWCVYELIQKVGK